MSSFVRRLQIRIWKKQARQPFDHNGKHGGFIKVKVPNTDLVIPRTAHRWPLLASAFNQQEA